MKGELPFDPGIDWPFHGVRVIESNRLERGRAFVTADRSVIVGTALARGVPYRIEAYSVMTIEGGDGESFPLGPLTLQRAYVLGYATDDQADVLDACTGAVYSVWFHPDKATMVAAARDGDPA